jgi:hypothetical protein
MTPLPIPEQLVPRPRLVIWHGDPETEEEQRTLALLDRAYYNTVAHLQLTGNRAGGNDWSGWHCPDLGMITGLCEFAASIAPAHWHLLLELEVPA